MRLIYHPAARTEAIQAALYYDERSPGRGIQFMDAIDEAVQAILRAPILCAVVDFDVRRKSLKRYPYGIYYRIVNDSVYIVAVHHHSRDRDSWKQRLSRKPS